MSGRDDEIQFLRGENTGVFSEPFHSFVLYKGFMRCNHVVCSSNLLSLVAKAGINSKCWRADSFDVLEKWVFCKFRRERLRLNDYRGNHFKSEPRAKLAKFFSAILSAMLSWTVKIFRVKCLNLGKQIFTFQKSAELTLKFDKSVEVSNSISGPETASYTFPIYELQLISYMSQGQICQKQGSGVLADS